MTKLTKFQRQLHYLTYATGVFNDDVWWFCDNGRIELWTRGGCLGSISFRQLRAAIKNGEVARK